MALTIGAGGGGGAAAASTLPIGTGRNHHFLRPPILFSSFSFWSLHQFTAARNGNNMFVVKAAKKLSSSRTGKFDSKNKRSLVTPTKEEEQQQQQIQRSVQIETDDSTSGGVAANADDGYFLPDLPGLKPDFWEGPQWDTLGFFVQYLWAFGILFAIIACGIAVATYNEGATDFKATPAYKESIQSRELLEEPEGSNSDVFESNPTEEAPSLE